MFSGAFGVLPPTIRGVSRRLADAESVHRRGADWPRRRRRSRCRRWHRRRRWDRGCRGARRRHCAGGKVYLELVRPVGDHVRVLHRASSDARVGWNIKERGIVAHARIVAWCRRWNAPGSGIGRERGDGGTAVRRTPIRLEITRDLRVVVGALLGRLLARRECDALLQIGSGVNGPGVPMN